MMVTLKQLISRQINKGFAIGAFLCALLFLGYSVYSIQQSARQAELLIISQASSLAESASVSQDLYSVQKEISRFVESLNQTQPYSARIEVRMDGRLIGSAGDYPALPMLASSISKSLSAGSGRSFELIAQIDHTRSLTRALLGMFLLIVLVGPLFALMKRAILRAVLRTTDPLAALISEIERISRSLPGALSEPIAPPPATTLEVNGLNLALSSFVSEICTLQTTLSKSQTDKVRYAMASQVAHDIRSPLAALAAAEKELAALPEDTRIMIRGAIGRIRDIANDLLHKNSALETSKGKISGAQEPKDPQLLSSLIEEIVTEKRMQYRSRLGVEIEALIGSDSYGLFASVQPREFKRVLSNLINNAIEAIPENIRGKIVVNLEKSKTEVNNVLLQIRDNGKGIPAEILGRLTTRGETHGKKGGSGLGLFHARASCEAWGGTLSIESVVTQGAIISITVPRCDSPTWFTDRISLRPATTIVILDDDPSIHRIWQGRFEPILAQYPGIKIEHLTTPAQFRAWHDSYHDDLEGVICLIDYELLGFRETGLELVYKFGLSKQSILVTSRFEDISVRERCLQLDVQMLPKGMAGFVPIEFEPVKRCPDLVLVDDDPLVHLMWNMSAKQNGKKLLSFQSSADFLLKVDELDRQTPLYIDESLGAGSSGIAIARDLHSRGFKKLFLASGYSASYFGEQPWLTGIVGKEAPSWL